MTKTTNIDDLTVGKLRADLSQATQAQEVITQVKTHIIVLISGFVYVGDPTFSKDKKVVTITNARCLRNWGTTKGLGELVNGPLSQTKLDEAGVVIVPIHAIIHLILCKKNW